MNFSSQHSRNKGRGWGKGSFQSVTSWRCPRKDPQWGSSAHATWGRQRDPDYGKCAAPYRRCLFLFLSNILFFSLLLLLFFNLSLASWKIGHSKSPCQLFPPAHLKTCCLLFTPESCAACMRLISQSLLAEFDLVDFSPHPFREVSPRDLFLFPAFVLFLFLRKYLHAQIFISYLGANGFRDSLQNLRV